MTEHYANKMAESINIAEQYVQIGPSIISHIGETKEADVACAKLFLKAGTNLSGQILRALTRGDLQLAAIGLRTLFEMSVNANYIFNHPEFQKSKIHANRLSQEYIELIHDRSKVNHTRLDGKQFKQRAEKVLGDIYKRNYPILCDWAHLQGQMPYLYKSDNGEKLGISVAENTLHALHNIFDPVCFFYDFKLDPEFEKKVSGYGKV